MFRIETEKELLSAFRSRDRKYVELPKGTRLPLFVRDYLSWVDPYGVRVFLVFSAPGSNRLTGIAFRRDQQGDKALSARVCDWCLNPGAADQIGLLTTDVDAKRRVGVNLCLDLRCNERLESRANLEGGSALEDTQSLTGERPCPGSRFPLDGALDDPPRGSTCRAGAVLGGRVAEEEARRRWPGLSHLQSQS